jgi:synaptobrevin family protein YKT6
VRPAQLTDDYLERFGERWRQQAEDSIAGDEMATAAIGKYQDPAAADKLLQIQRELDETKIVLHKTIDSVLARGEKLDNLVEKSSDLSLASQMFYKQARKTNSCCGMM